MTSVAETGRPPARPALGTFERYLTVWVAFCIVAGMVLGRLLPAPFRMLGRVTLAEVNIPVAVLNDRADVDQGRFRRAASGR